MSNVKRRGRSDAELMRLLSAPNVKRWGRSDAELMRLIGAQQAEVWAIEMTRRRHGVTIEAFAAAAGVSLRCYYRARAGEHLIREATMAKLRVARRRAAAGSLA